MYVPAAFREERLDVLHDLMRRESFATLVSYAAAPMASHLPLLIDARRGPRGTLLGHMARANPQWQSFVNGGEVVAIFHGPHSYISPAWYASKVSVPTWNYVAVHAYGRPALMEDERTLRELLASSVNAYESPMPRPWNGRLPEDVLTKLVNSVVGFEIPIDRIEGQWKLGQNRSAADRRGAIAGLESLGQPLAAEVAALMAVMLDETPKHPSERP